VSVAHQRRGNKLLKEDQVHNHLPASDLIYSMWYETREVLSAPYIFTFAKSLALSLRPSKVPVPHGRFKMLYSFHPSSHTPSQLANGLLDCSGDDYSTFQQHVHCNLRVECVDGRDETGQ
jgi:hypothetical protein